jgi:tight adherence protein B
VTRRSRARAPDVARIASVVQRLAVLLAAGVAPVSAWGYLREGEVAQRIADDASRGTPIPDAIVAALLGAQPPVPDAESAAWHGLATAWAVATEAGAPLAPTLREFAGSLRSLAQAQREIHLALAAPAATAKLVMALPLVGVLFGMVLGFNTFATLTSTPIGLACLVIGGGLMLAAAAWNRALVRTAQPRDLTPGLEFDLVAIAVSGGAALDRSRASVERAIATYGVAPPSRPTGARAASRARPPHPARDRGARVHRTVARHSDGRRADSPDAEEQLTGVDAVLDLSRRAGVPAAELLRSEAEEARRSARAEVQERASTLAIKLMLPLGLCVLPAFMVLGVFPLLVSVITSTVNQF